MRPRLGLRLAPVIFSFVVVFAVGALAWGATHSKSTGDGIGSAKNQAAAKAMLQTGLTLPAGLVRDPTFTACGGIADVCLTGSTSLATTLSALAGVVHAAGGSLPSQCSAVVTGTSGSVPKFTCLVQGRLHGTAVTFLLGDGWLLPGKPTPRTAVVVNVEKENPTSATHPAGVPASAADAASLLPATWARAPQPCASGSTSAAPSPAPASSPASTPSTPTTAAPLVPTSAPLPACATSAITLNVSVHLALSAAASQLSALALTKGFRIDGHPCIAGSTPTSCGVWGERISSGVEELFVATLTDDGRGDTTGTLAVTNAGSLTQQG